MIRAALLLCLALAGPAWAGVECRDVDHEGRGYAVCSVTLDDTALKLFLRDDDGAILGGFSRVADELGPDETLEFAMNAGMFHPDRAPVGLYIEDGREEMRVIPNPGPGNFGLLPNGLLCLRAGRADVIETLRYIEDAPPCREATQSGPMLVIDGALHPRFLPDSTSRNIRNGVGTSADGRVAHFAISDRPVTFHEFARLFRDALEAPNALYFDGKVSRLYAPQLGRNDIGLPLGPIIGAVSPAPSDRATD
ncbi:phosphodiester glycosidase family protein [Poseidonocella sedimentorum]|uniref:Uncharacterized protein YigE, DUF2233 family n=1 Tax=Poseidonocella sedimentorum TaxID=871652 RepID=A0A1I6E966_9RHOB|nr:phosphodiester glycosidase family protein [Poseidonocella sedimentorum]SFR14269.1 Uncharacterized protein YigE, DUF2233 family [Poseidonocella sedimentorum]